MTIPSNEFQNRAKQLLDSRMGAVEDLAKGLDRIRRAEDELQAARDEFAVAYQSAVRAGWSEAELQRLDVPKPSAPKRPRKARAARKVEARPAPVETQEPPASE